MAQAHTQLITGILAHVDAGKTTLSEAMLYHSGQLRRLGRVDHGDAFLDTDGQERERGITIFSKQARLTWGGREITLLDTPGHVDFSSEMERTLQVLDCAVLVISGVDGVQGHTLTLWRLLERYQIPTFLFLNKMDQPGADPAALLDSLRRHLSDNCVDLAAPDGLEQAAMCDETALDQFLNTGTLPDEALATLIQARRLFPCYFGAALRPAGVEALLDALARYGPVPVYGDTFAARVYKVARDHQGVRLTYLKLTGGSLRVKAALTGRTDGPAGVDWSEKVNQIRLYSGARYETAECVPAGTVCAVTGLSHTRPGDGLGAAAAAAAPVLEPVFTHRVRLPDGADPRMALQHLQQLEEEDPQLHVVWDAQLQCIRVQLMGQVQLEVLQRRLQEQFDLAVTFDDGGILYRETITAPVEGAGHYEPLRHYAEVHLLLEPAPRGSGLQVASACPEDVLERNWQRLILTHLQEKTHLGVLTGSPITDLTITLVAGRAHPKHTEGGDFRQATYRAVRQGLMGAESILLEPWYDLRLELPAACVGRAMTDLQRFGGEVKPPETVGGEAVLIATAPVAQVQNYAREVAAYTRGQGRLFCTPRGYAPCQAQQAVVDAIGYDCRRDLENPADSIFCSHGAGISIPWDQAPAHMHVDSGLRLRRPAAPARQPDRQDRPASRQDEDAALQAIFERTYGPVKRRDFAPPMPASQAEPAGSIPAPPVQEYLLVDGYNMIFAWEELAQLAQTDLGAARQALMEILCNYQGFRQCVVILVFDAYRVPRVQRDVVRYHNIHVVYTKTAETADSYIEKATYAIARHCRVRVATSDNLEQLIILGHCALRISASGFRAEVEQANSQIAAILKEMNRATRPEAIRTALERAKRGGEAPSDV